MSVESRPGSLSGLGDDRLGTVAVSLAVAELSVTPDVMPAVMDRIARDAAAYPEQFDRRLRPPAPPPLPPPSGRSAKRAVGRLAVIGVVVAIVVALVIFAASASARESVTVGAGTDLPAGMVAPVPIGAISGRLVSFGADETGKVFAVEHGSHILHVVTEDP